MAVDVSRIPNNNKFDPVREAILDLQTQLEEEGQIAYDGTLTLSEGAAVTLTGGSTFTANQSGDTTITIGVDLSVTTNAASGGGSLSYLDGEFTYTPPDLSSFIELTDLSITTSSTPSGGGALSYDDTTGVFTFTPADAGTGLTLQQVTANGNTTNYGISTGNISVQPSGTGSGIVTIQANSVGDARLDLTAGTGGTGVIKTTNDVAITFEPNATEKVVIASDGNMNVYEKLAVGKTTAAATYHLEVDGTALANNFITSMTAVGTTYTGTVSQYYNALQIRTGTGGTISLGGSGPMSVQNNVAIKDGDLDVNGDVTADFFIGDGSQLTNIAGTSSDLDDVTTNGATTTNDISTGRITIANNVSTGGFSSFDDYQILLYKDTTSSTSYGLGIESNTMMFHSNNQYRFYVNNSIKVTINSSGNISATSFTGDGSGLTSVDADTLDSYQLSGTSSVSDKIFNNKGLIHSTFTDFNTVMNAGANYLQGGTNGPTGDESHQWYGFMLGLGSDYGTSTGTTGDYASQLYWGRQSQGSNAYLWARDMESGTWGSWRKMSAGNADNADTLNGVAGSGFLRSDADDTATGKITINNNSNSINDPTLTISSSQGGGSFGRLMFSGTSTVAGVINRSDAGSHLYFDEDATTGNYHFRSSGRAYYYGSLTVGSTNDTEGKLVVRGDANSGMVSFFKNLDTGTTAYAEVIVRSVDSSNDLRLGASKSYTDTEWQGGWVFAPRSLKLKSNNDVNIFAGGTGNDSIVATFTSTGLGVGTTLPSGILDVQGSSTSDHLVRFWNKDSSGTGKSIVRIANSGNNTLGSQLQMTDNTYYLATLAADRTNGLNFYVGQMSGYTDNLRMKIDINGNVVIGKDSQSGNAALTVKSTAGGNTGLMLIEGDTTNDGHGLYATTDNKFVITRFTNGSYSDNFVINSSGNVGIGTTSPTTGRLVVHDGDIEVRDSTGNSGGRIKAFDNFHSIYFREGAQNRTNYYQYGGTLSAGLGHRFLTGGTSQSLRMQIADDGIYMANNVGIGTTSPSTKLEVRVASGDDNQFRISASENVYKDAQWKDTTSGEMWIWSHRIGSDANKFQAWYNNGSSWNSEPALSFDTANNVSINTPTPLLTSAGRGNLTVNGSSDAVITLGVNGTWKSYYYVSGTGTYLASSSGTPIHLEAGGSTKMYLASGGNVGIGTTTPSAKLDVNGIIKANGNQVNPQEYGVSMVGNFGQWQAHGTYNNFNTVPSYWGWNYIQGNTNAPNSSSSQWYRGRFSLGDAYGLGTSSNDYWMEIAVPRYNYAGGDAGQMFVRACEDGNEGSWYQVGRKIIGDFTATGDVVAYASSDKRLKDNITPIPNALDKVSAIGGYEFDWNDNQETYEGHDVGVIAQEVEEVMPEVVTTREDGYKAVKYEKMVPLLIEAIKEQQKQIDELKSKLDGITN
jgi:hypothetical protein